MYQLGKYLNKMFSKFQGSLVICIERERDLDWKPTLFAQLPAKIQEPAAKKIISTALKFSNNIFNVSF